MIEYVLNYMESKEQFVSTTGEANAVEKGIRMYLEENGIFWKRKENISQIYRPTFSPYRFE